MKVFYPVFGFVLFLMVGCFDMSEPTLPVYGFKKVVEKTVNGETIIDSLDHQIPPFSLVTSDRHPLPASKPAISPRTILSRKAALSLPCHLI